MEVAVIGLGRMGTAIGERLLHSGHNVLAWNRSPHDAGALTALGARVVPDLPSALASAVVVTALTDDGAVRSVCLTDESARPELRGTIVDCTTCSPATSRAMAAAYAGRFVAAPIIGSPDTVRAGRATLIIGGQPDAVESARDVLTAISPGHRPVGPDAGHASVLKLLNNYLLMVGTISLADAVVIGRAGGLPDALIQQSLASLATVPASSRARLDSLIDSEHDGWFSVGLALKDLQLAAAVAAEADLGLALAQTAIRRYQLASEAGWQSSDITAVIETIRDIRPGS